MHDYTTKSYILFDLDGTVTDPKEGITKAVQHALRSLGVAADNLDELTKFIGPPLQQSFQEFYGFDAATAAIAVDKYREYYGPQGIFECLLYPGITELLQLLASQGRKVLLATSKPTVYAERILDYWHLRSFFHFVAGSELSGERVAKQEVISYALEQCSIPPAEALMIGDRRHDIQGANALGVPCLAVAYGYGDLEELTAAQPAAIVHSVAELQKLLCGDATVPLKG